jgi:hypothetical protein
MGGLQGSSPHSHTSVQLPEATTCQAQPLPLFLSVFPGPGKFHSLHRVQSPARRCRLQGVSRGVRGCGGQGMLEEAEVVVVGASLSMAGQDWRVQDDV